jgi:branched-subunit amino acid transport protein
LPCPLPYFKVNIYPFPLPHFASICFAYLWSFRPPNYIVTLPRYFSFRVPHLNITIGPPSDELDKNSQRTWLSENVSHWNGYSHFRSGLNWLRKFKKRCFKNQMSVMWSWAYFYNLHWNNYLYFKGLLYYNNPYCLTIIFIILEQSLLSYNNPYCLTTILTVLQQSLLSDNNPYCLTTILIVLQQSLLSYNNSYFLTTILTVLQQSLLSYNNPYCLATIPIVLQQSLLSYNNP